MINKLISFTGINNTETFIFTELRHTTLQKQQHAAPKTYRYENIYTSNIVFFFNHSHFLPQFLEVKIRRVSLI